VLVPAEAARLVAAIRDPRDRALWATAFYAGLRRGELLALRWQDVELAAGLLHVRRAYDPKAGATIPPKSKAGERTLAIPEVLYDELAAWRARCPWQQGLVFGDGPAAPAGLWRLVQRPRRDLADGVTLHVARHCYVTWCAEGGVGADLLQRAAGHSSVAVTLDVYRHVLDRTIRRPAELLQAYIDADLERERREQPRKTEP
jgi:integrase